MSYKVLIIEDDVELGEQLRTDLRGVGYRPTLVSSLRLAERAAGSDERAFDILLVDRMLPDGDGAELIRRMRAEDDRTPALLLTALDDIAERINGLNCGADDYLCKPCDSGELIARIEALMRRSQLASNDQINGLSNSGDATHESPTRFTVADLCVDLLARKATRDGIELRLQPQEFKLLSFFVKHLGMVVTRAMLLKHVWDIEFDPQTNVVDVHVSRLRTKIDRDFSQPLLHTIRGQGYQFGELG